MKYKSNNKSVIFASITASFFMLAFGFSYRILLVRLKIPISKVPIDPSALERLPMQIGPWIGITTSIDDEIVSRTNADAIINRRYSNTETSESVSLYIACGIKTSEIMAHHPEVCYPGNGWTLVGRNSMELPIHNGTKLPCNIFQFSRGELEKDKAIVLHYLIVDGSYLRDVSLARTSLWRITSGAYYVAQIHITSLSRNTQATGSAKKNILDFAVDSTPLIADLFKQIQKEQIAHYTSQFGNGDSIQ